MALVELLGETLQRAGGDSEKGAVETYTLAGEGRYVGIYFSALGCPPCRRFTPKLVQFYNQFKKTEKGESLEIVLVSGDPDQESFDEHFAEMPWLAIPFTEPQKRLDLCNKYEVLGIPVLVIVDANSAELVTDRGRDGVTTDPTGQNFPWT
ncbi:uncharacterized protein [Branchiostoma lanceolatum]|uniref:uncharacterized protein n=1 Tax=Branchiostoma lanceolatum TaxID=7740 RepID=UPI0034515938